jgi:hypothetical protein
VGSIAQESEHIPNQMKAVDVADSEDPPIFRALTTRGDVVGFF